MVTTLVGFEAKNHIGKLFPADTNPYRSAFRRLPSSIQPTHLSVRLLTNSDLSWVVSGIGSLVRDIGGAQSVPKSGLPIGGFHGMIQ